ncbi:MAG: undecaprenyldiphospho-muramoylpentapeptide beta-N-acetylglucosaminyltransferase [Candidatus Zixiibacteriota bacterium]
MIKVMFAGGKTGGHIFPAIAMAKEFKKRFPQSHISFAGTEGGMEAKIVPPLGFELSFIRNKGLSRRSHLSNFLLGIYILKSLCQAYRLLSLKKPNLVVGTGGYVSFPVVFVAGLKRIPIMLQEQNSYPGISTRFLAHLADIVCLSYPESIRYFGLPGKIRLIGNPIREDLVWGEKDQAREKLHLDEDKKTIFVFGGSQGAHGINMTMLQSLELLKSECQILWQTGESDYSAITGKVKNQRIKCVVLPFIEDMGSAYAASDIVVSRSGALTLAEITACGKPSILVPFPFATADHQRHNAEALQKQGAARMILQKDLTPERLAQEIDSLLADEVNLKNMADQSKKMGKPEATSLLVDEMEKLLKYKRGLQS